MRFNKQVKQIYNKKKAQKVIKNNNKNKNKIPEKQLNIFVRNLSETNLPLPPFVIHSIEVNLFAKHTFFYTNKTVINCFF